MRENFNAEVIAEKCINWIRDWFANNGSGCKAVIGISGGKDSTVVAALCVKALGAENVIGVLMPQGIQPDIDDSLEVVKALGIKYYEINIGNSYNLLVSQLLSNNINFSDQARMNLPCRLRMSALYAVSQSVNGRVANTCNLSENYIGWCTRWGDSVGDFAPLEHLLSDEVIAIGKALNMGIPEYLLNKTPSDGLCNKTDEDAFGFSYEVLNHYIMTGECEDIETKKKIDTLHNKSKFKFEPIPGFMPI